MPRAKLIPIPAKVTCHPLFGCSFICIELRIVPVFTIGNTSFLIITLLKKPNINITMPSQKKQPL